MRPVEILTQKSKQEKCLKKDARKRLELEIDIDSS
jgi:hypothetical protein